MPAEKIKRLHQRVGKNFYEKLPFDEIGSALDWGCGGGMHTLTLAQKVKRIIHAADISQESLDECTKYLTRHGINGDKFKKILIPENVEKLNLIKIAGKIDLIFCADVIHHFPSLNYLAKVAEVWKKISPKYMCLQFKVVDGNVKDRPDYFKAQNYIHSLILSKDYVLNLVGDSYSELSYGEEKAKFGNVKHGFLVLKKM
jgi:2-polyprenyl-3-methyl-5-hydroxy-6-metoxy-1,4-benzoquinol methylase